MDCHRAFEEYKLILMATLNVTMTFVKTYILPSFVTEDILYRKKQ